MATRSSRRVLRFIGLFASIALVATACGDDSDSDTAGGESDASSTTVAAAGEGEPCPADRRGGELVYFFFFFFFGLDPIVAAGTGLTGTNQLSALYSPLMRYDQETGEYAPYLAESVEHNDDYTEWTVTLREGVTYGNGDAMTAEDVRWNLERTKSEENQSATRRQAAAISEIEVVDDLTVVLRLDEPGPDLGWVLSDESGMMVNPRVVESQGADEFNIDPTGAGVGPYELVRFSPGDEVVFEAKDSYWGGAACVQTLRFVVPGGSQPAFDALDNGEIDVAWLNEPRVVQEAKDAGYDGLSYLLNANLMVVMNAAEGPTADPRIRRAVALAIDEDHVDDRVNDGTGLPTSALIHPDSLLSPGVDGPDHDLEEAQRLVDEVKAEGEWDGTIDLISHNIQRYVDSTIAVEGLLEAAGFDVNFETPAAVNEVVRTVTIDGGFTLSIWGIALSDVNPFAGLVQLTSTSPTSYIGYENPDFDAGVEQLQRAPDVDAKREALAEVQSALTADPPFKVLAAEEEYVAHGDHVHGLELSTDFFLFDHAWIEE